MKRLITIGAVTAASLTLGGTVFAGEITGNGDPTPIAEWRAGSICSFSGLNDDPDEPGAEGKVQNWATAFKAALKEEGLTVSEAAGLGLFKEFGPGTACRGYASGG